MVLHLQKKRIVKFKSNTDFFCCRNLVIFHEVLAKMFENGVNILCKSLFFIKPGLVFLCF